MTDYVTISEAAHLCGISISTFNDHYRPGTHKRKSPLPPPAIRYGGKPLWRREDIIEWNTSRDNRRGPGKATGK